MCSCTYLTENDIPGAKLQFPADQIEKCTKTQLQLWLKCRQLKYKSTDTKAVLVDRVRLCMKASQIYSIVDPDPTKSYTRKKQINCVKCGNAGEPSQTGSDAPTIESGQKTLLQLAPKEGWTEKATDLPPFFLDQA